MKNFHQGRCFFTLFRIPYIGGKRKKIFFKKGFGTIPKFKSILCECGYTCCACCSSKTASKAKLIFCEWVLIRFACCSLKLRFYFRDGALKTTDTHVDKMMSLVSSIAVARQTKNKVRLKIFGADVRKGERISH